MNLQGWSFCIVSIPENEALLSQCIASIEREFSGQNDCEIVVVGANVDSIINCSIPVQIIPFEEEVFSLTWRNFLAAYKSKSLRRLIYRSGAICHKKNIAARAARFDKLCIMHDYVSLCSGWKRGLLEFGDDWEVMMTIVLNADGSRHRDWLCWNHPLIASDKGKLEACLMPYDCYTKYMYISGTYFCVKQDFFLQYPLNEKLFWGEGEDVEWSMRVREKTRFRMNTNSVVRYLKLKSLEGAPYCVDWVRNKRLLDSVIADRKEF